MKNSEEQNGAFDPLNKKIKREYYFVLPFCMTVYIYYKNKIILREAIILCFNYSFFSIDLTNFDKYIKRVYI